MKPAQVRVCCLWCPVPAFLKHRCQMYKVFHCAHYGAMLEATCNLKFKKGNKITLGLNYFINLLVLFKRA